VVPKIKHCILLIPVAQHIYSAFKHEIDQIFTDVLDYFGIKYVRSLCALKGMCLPRHGKNRGRRSLYESTPRKEAGRTKCCIMNESVYLIP
jgi:hypothetical protein